MTSINDSDTSDSETTETSSSAQVVNLTPNIRKALYEYIKRFAVPAVKPDSILFGNQNDITLPDTDNYIIFTPLSSYRHGTTSEEWQQVGDDRIRLLHSVEVPVQIDCYADNSNGTDGMNAYLRAQSLEVVARSSVGVHFFKKRGLSVLYADDPRDTTIVGDSSNYLRRWTTTLHLCFKAGVEVPMKFFNTVTFNIQKIY